MKTKLKLLTVSAWMLACITFWTTIVFGQGTAFTYQGRLQNNGTPANGSYDLKLSLFSTNQSGVPFGPTITNAAVPVANGLFTTTLDFGGGIFNGTNLWLDISVRTNGNGTFTELAPRQPITPAPYAITAGNLAGVLENNLIQGGTALATIGGGSNNVIQTGASYSVISAGHDNLIANGAVSAAIGGGSDNFASGGSTTIGGGQNNFASAGWATIGGGYENTASNLFATVGGGSVNSSGGQSATVAGGEGNVASGDWSTVVGGYNNIASGSEATVGGGSFNLASGADSFAAGFEARATNAGAFVWADSQNATFSSTRSNQFSIRAGGGVVMNISGSSGLSPAAVTINSTSGNGIGILVNESSSDTAALFANGGAGDIIKGFSGQGNTVFEVLNDGTVRSKGVVLTSDRNAKQNFAALDNESILSKVISLPVTEWNYKDDAADQKHIGPMAQDFHAAFQLNGTDDKHISVIDEGGVALAAIQGLNQKVEEQHAELNQKETEIIGLKKRLDALEQILTQSKAN